MPGRDSLSSWHKVIWVLKRIWRRRDKIERKRARCWISFLGEELGVRSKPRQNQHEKNLNSPGKESWWFLYQGLKFKTLFSVCFRLEKKKDNCFVQTWAIETQQLFTIALLAVQHWFQLKVVPLLLKLGEHPKTITLHNFAFWLSLYIGPRQDGKTNIRVCSLYICSLYFWQHCKEIMLN